MSRLARALTTLTGQVDAVFPTRDRRAGGCVTGHPAAYTLAGETVVTGLDVAGLPGDLLDDLAGQIFAGQDGRVAWVLHNRMILHGAAHPDRWTWQPWGGLDLGLHHLHVEVVQAPACDDPAEWALPMLCLPGRRAALRPGCCGGDVATLQRTLDAWLPWPVKVDGVYGPRTEYAVRCVQAGGGVRQDGVVGPRTLTTLGLDLEGLHRCAGHRCSCWTR